MSTRSGKSEQTDKFPGAPPGSPGIGLALGGGLARGFAHIGALKALNKNGIFPSTVAGTSIGALAGGSYLAGKLDILEDWALSLNRMRVLSYLDFQVRSPGLLGGKKLTALLEKHFGDASIADLPHPFIAIASDLITGHEIWMRKGNIVNALRASFALPGVFAPVERNHRFLVDGALVNPVPVSVTRALGAHMVIAVDLSSDLVAKAAQPGQHYQTVAGFDPFNEQDVPKEQQKLFSASTLTRRLFRREPDSPSMFGVMFSSLGIIQDRITRSRLAGDPPDVHIRPKIGHIGMLEFERAEELIALGYESVEEAMPEIRAAIDVLLPAPMHPDNLKKPPPDDIPPQI